MLPSAVGVEPVLDLLAAEPDEGTELVVGDTPLGDEAAHVAFGDGQPRGQAGGC